MLMISDIVASGLASRYLIEVGFAIALAASLWQRRWGWAVVLALAVAESHFALRYPFHVWVRDSLLGYPSDHAEKTALQSTLLQGAVVLGLVVFLALVPKLRTASAGFRLMAGGTAIVLGVLAVELISTHRMDAVIYHREGPFARVAIAYFIGALAIAGGMAMASQPSPGTAARVGTERTA